MKARRKITLNGLPAEAVVKYIMAHMSDELIEQIYVGVSKLMERALPGKKPRRRRARRPDQVFIDRARCPNCGWWKLKIIRSNSIGDEDVTMERDTKCLRCEHRFTVVSRLGKIVSKNWRID